VVFATLEKFDAGRLRPIHTPQIKQISGRAGRFQVPGARRDTDDTGGAVTTIKKSDLTLLLEGISTPNPILTHAMLWPPFRVFEKFAQQCQEGTPLATIISQFVEVCKTSPLYRAVESESQLILAQAIEEIPNIDFESRYNITFAPVQQKSLDQMISFVALAEVLSNARPVTVESRGLKIPLHVLSKKNMKITPCTLHTLEVIHKLIMCFCWLSYNPIY
jgi:ATP-dependent RNA helicase SUPV3L1/SUV3